MAPTREDPLHLDIDLRHPRARLVQAFNAVIDAFSMSSMENQLVQEVEESMNLWIALARAHPDLSQSQADISEQRRSMIPASNRKVSK